MGMMLLLTACSTTQPPSSVDAEDGRWPAPKAIVAPVKPPTQPLGTKTVAEKSADAPKHSQTADTLKTVKPPAVASKSSPSRTLLSLFHAPKQDLWERLRSGFQIIPQNHPLIMATVKNYQNNPEYFIKLQKQAEPYLHYILTQVEQRQMPTEIALLPAIESSFIPQAVSPKAAAGLWQFVPGTGREYGLKQDEWFDGRQDIQQSTTAALDYLQLLYDQFGSWSLALAAYNCGPNKIEKLLQAQMQANEQEYPTYWTLLDNLPNETQNYVPKLLALATIIAEPQKYQVELPPFEEAVELAQVEVQYPLDLGLIARMANLSLEKLKQLNPGYKRNNIGRERRSLLLPKQHAVPLEQQLASLPPELLLAANTEPSVKPEPSAEKSWISVEKGITLLKQQYQTTLKNVSKGKTQNQRVHMGKQLIVLAKPTTAKPAATKPALAANTKPSSPTQTSKPGKTYTVKVGDTLWTIASQHGISTQQIAQLNAIKPNTKVRAGQKLIVQAQSKT